MSDTIRILRVIEYSGPRAAVEDQVSRSLHGEKKFNNGVVIRAATVGSYPELLNGLPEVEGHFVSSLESGKCVTCHHDIMHHGIRSDYPGCAYTNDDDDERPCTAYEFHRRDNDLDSPDGVCDKCGLPKELHL